MNNSFAGRPRIITKSIIRNQYGLLETTNKLGSRKHKFFATRKEAASFLRRLHSLRLRRAA